VSYDLVFWQQELKADLDPHATYVQLADGNRVDGLADIPLEDIFAGLREVFRQPCTS
jgi:hypothetical protein